MGGNCVNSNAVAKQASAYQGTDNLAIAVSSLPERSANAGLARDASNAGKILPSNVTVTPTPKNNNASSGSKYMLGFTPGKKLVPKSPPSI